MPLFLTHYEVRKKGFEPSRGNPHKNLNLARLPIPTFPHVAVFQWIVIIEHAIVILLVNGGSVNEKNEKYQNIYIIYNKQGKGYY